MQMISGEVKFLLTHSSIYGLGTAVSRIVALIMLPLYTKCLTPADYGILESLDITTGIIGIAITVKIARSLSRFYYESEKKKERNRVVSTTYLGYGLIAFPFTPLLWALAVPLAGVLFGSDLYGYYFKVSFASLLLGGLVDIGMMYLRVLKKPAIFISISIGQLLCLLGLNILFILYLDMGVLGILYSSLIVKGVGALGLTVGVLSKTGIRFSKSLFVDMLKFGLPMIPANLAETAVKQSDKYFVLHFLSIADLGIYSLALKLGNSIHNLLTMPFNMAYIPRRFEIMQTADASKTYAKIFTYYVFLVGYVGLVLSALVPEILQLMVTSRDFLRAGSFVPPVVFSMIIYGCHYHFDFGILHSKKTKYLAYINGVCAVFHFGANWVLIRGFGLWGGVWASLLVLGLQAFLLHRISQKLFPIRYEFGRIFAYLLLGAMFYGVCAWLDTGSLLLDIGVKISLLVVFPLLAVAFRIVSQNDAAKILEALKVKLRRRSPSGAPAVIR